MSGDLELDELFGGRSRKGTRELLGQLEDRTTSPVPEITVSVETVSPEHIRRVGRPSKPVGDRYVDRVKRAAYYVDTETLDRLDAFCQRTGVPKSEVVRDGIALYLKQKEGT